MPSGSGGWHHGWWSVFIPETGLSILPPAQGDALFLIFGLLALPEPAATVLAGQIAAEKARAAAGLPLKCVAIDARELDATKRAARERN